MKNLCAIYFLVELCTQHSWIWQVVLLIYGSQNDIGRGASKRGRVRSRANVKLISVNNTTNIIIQRFKMSGFGTSYLRPKEMLHLITRRFLVTYHTLEPWSLLPLSSPRAESARAVTGRRNSHKWEGGRLFEPSAGFFYGNSCNSGTKSRKIVSKVGN